MSDQQSKKSVYRAEYCRNVKQGSVPREANNPGAGYIVTDVYCNKPLFLSVAEGRKVCPDCDKEPPVGNVHPRVTNASGVKLTPKEMQDCGLNPDGTRIDGKELPKRNIEQAVATAVEAKVEIVKPVVKADEVVLTIPLKDLEGDVDVASFLIKKVIEGFGTLPTPTYAESKRVMKLETKLEGLLGA